VNKFDEILIYQRIKGRCLTSERFQIIQLAQSKI